MKRHLLMWGTAALMATMLSACGGGGGSTDAGGTGSTGSTATGVSGIASKGPINGGTVTVYALNDNGTKGNFLGTDTTGADGSYNIDIGTYNGNVLVEVTGGTYTDEATGTDKANTTLRAALTGATGNVTMAITPLTELAVKKAGSALTKSAIEEANSIVTVLAGGIDIVGTIPSDASKAAGTSVDDTAYSLILAAISQMSADQNKTVEEVIDAIKTDLDDDGIAQTAAPELKTALQNFIASPNNLSGVTDLTQTGLSTSLDFIATTPVNTDAGNTSDVTKAKKLISDFRNTILSVANYKGVGSPGMVETPFNRLSTEMTTEIEPALASSADRLGWIIQASAMFLDGLSYNNQDSAGNTLTLTQNGSTLSFVVKDPSDVTLDSGSLTINNLDTPTSGSLTGTIKTPTGNATVAVNYTGAFTNGLISSVNFTGSIVTPELSFDFSQSGRKLSVTLAPDPNNRTTGETDVYPTSVSFSGRITTKTARFDGALSGSIGWAAKEHGWYDYWSDQTICWGDPVPKSGTFTGSFAEIINGADSGMKFTGTINASFPNATTYDGCAPASNTNFRQWSASFDGKIEATNRPAITVFLKATESQRDVLAVEAKYMRTNTNGTIVTLSGTGQVLSDEATSTTILNFTNQDGLKLYIKADDNLPCTEKFTGTIKTSGNEKLADLYTISNPGCVPTVKYIDDYMESIF